MGLAGELGLSDESKINLEHKILLTAASSLATPLADTLRVISQTSRDASKTFKIVGYAAASYLIMAGIARIIESLSISSSKTLCNNDENKKEDSN